MMRHILAAACAAFTAYMLVSFVVWEMNPANWHESTRFSAATLGTIFAFAAAMLSIGPPKS